MPVRGGPGYVEGAEENALKIGFISPEFPPAIGGVETYAFQYVQALRRMRPAWELTVLTRPHPEGEIEIPGVEILPLLRRRRRIDRGLVKSHRADAWHVMNAAYGWLAAEAPRVVVTVHGNDFLRPYLPLLSPDLTRFLPFGRPPARLEDWERAWSHRFLPRLLQRTLPLARCILTNSKYTERALLDRFPACRGITVPAMVGVGADFAEVPHVERAQQEPVRLVTISRLAEPRKNIDLVLRALARLIGRHDFVYRVIGEGWDLPRLRALAQELGIAERVEFLGRLPQERMIGVLAASDLFVLVSSVLSDSHEGFGIVYLEANACGTPVLAARLGGAVEAVAEGTSGLFVDTADADAIAGALERFFRGQARFPAEACRAHALRFSWDAVVESALPCYGEGGP